MQSVASLRIPPFGHDLWPSKSLRWDNMTQARGFQKYICTTRNICVIFKPYLFWFECSVSKFLYGSDREGKMNHWDYISSKIGLQSLKRYVRLIKVKGSSISQALQYLKVNESDKCHWYYHQTPMSNAPVYHSWVRDTTNVHVYEIWTNLLSSPVSWDPSLMKMSNCKKSIGS